MPGRHRSEDAVQRDTRTIAIAATIGVAIVAALIWLVLR